MVLGIVVMPVFMLVGCYFYVDSLTKFLAGPEELLIIFSVFFGIVYTILANAAASKATELLRNKTNWTCFSAYTIVIDMGLLFVLYLIIMWSVYHYFVLPWII